MTEILNGSDVANSSSVRQATSNRDAIVSQLGDLSLAAAELGASNIPVVGTALDARSFWNNWSAGSYGGAFVDAIGMIPGLGDGAKTAIRGTGLARTGARLTGALQDARRSIDQARKAEAARLYSKMQKLSPFEKYKKALAKCKDEACRKKAKEQYKKDRYQRLPRNGTWTGSPGNSKFIPNKDTPLAETLKNKYPGQDGIQYRDGYPDFAPFSKEQVQIPNMGGDLHKGTGNLSDEAQARALMREQSPGWTKANEEGYVWHHKQDGSTMMLVDKDVHNTTQGGVAHVGGASMVQDPQY